jgi:hypothetical protein
VDKVRIGGQWNRGFDTKHCLSYRSHCDESGTGRRGKTMLYAFREQARHFGQ